MLYQMLNAAPMLYQMPKARPCSICPPTLSCTVIACTGAKEKDRSDVAIRAVQHYKRGMEAEKRVLR